MRGFDCHSELLHFPVADPAVLFDNREKPLFGELGALALLRDIRDRVRPADWSW